MGLVLLGDGERISTSGGVLHFDGFGWAGQVDEPVSAAPAKAREWRFCRASAWPFPATVGVRSAAFRSTASWTTKTSTSRSGSVWSGAGRSCFLDARADHAYEFVKGELKWRLLERNCWASVLRTYPAPLFALVMSSL
jgi:hypothetical protein